MSKRCLTLKNLEEESFKLIYFISGFSRKKVDQNLTAVKDEYLRSNLWKLNWGQVWTKH